MTLEPRANKLLIVDDEEFVREAIELYFVTEGFHVLTAANGVEALATIEREPVDVAVLDILMPGMDGIQLLREIKKREPRTEVVMASGCGTIESAIESLRLGAYDYVTKPILNFDEDLLKVVRKALERRRLLSANQKLTRDLKDINREIKESNARLKRSVAELEVLHETGRLLAELDTVDGILELAFQTLEHHFLLPTSFFALSEPDGWSVRCPSSLGSADSSCRVPTTSLTIGDATDVGVRVALQTDLATALTKFGVAPESLDTCVALPLRTLRRTLGVLLAFPSGPTPPVELLRRLDLLATLIAAPLALQLSGSGVTQ
ncbi:MAG: response regulator [Planctomycetota bacterium]